MKNLLTPLLFLIPIITFSQSIPISGDQYHLYGPNSTWGEYLKVGGNGRGTSYASLVTTNGNLHLDAKDGRPIYLNHYGQGNTLINPNGGKVGIGTLTPLAKFHIHGEWNGLIRFGNEGTDDNGKFYSTYEAGSPLLNFIEYDDPFIFNFLQTKDQVNVQMSFHQGKIGIGTKFPDALLSVKGHIHTQEVKVDLNGAVAPDYVFEKDYSLSSLEETEAYIKTNHHLPEVPSAAEMEENGIELKQMNLLLLKKIEEMTLHVIELNKRVHKLETENKQLKTFILER